MWIQTEFGALALEDVSGLVFPGRSTSTTDRLRVAVALKRKTAVDALLSRARCGGPTKAQTRALDRIEAHLERLGPCEYLQLLEEPALVHLLRNADESPVRSALGLARFAIETAESASGWASVLELLPEGGCYLPCLHARWDSGALQPGLFADTFKVLNGVAGIRTRDPSEALPCDPQRRDVERTLALLRAVWPQAQAGAARWYREVLILASPRNGRYLSFTSADLPGALIASVDSPVQLADSLVHEAAHARLAVYQDVDPMIVDDGQEVHPSPWRPDLRPMMGLLAGVHSFVNVHVYYAKLLSSGVAPEVRPLCVQKLQAHGEKLTTAWRYFFPRVRPTALGALFIEEINRYIQAL